MANELPVPEVAFGAEADESLPVIFPVYLLLFIDPVLVQLYTIPLVSL